MQVTPALTLTGRTAVVTGGARNIGLAIARRFVAAGMRVAILSVSEGSAEAAARIAHESKDFAIGVRCDVADVAAVDAALGRVAAHFGGFDVVVNSAGVLDIAKIPEQSVEHWDRVLAINLRGTFFVTQKALPYLERSNAARVINISSNSGRMGGYENGMAYSASKGGIIALTYGMARQLAARRITVNCIAPGTIESDMSRARDPEALARLLGRFPVGRLGTADEVAAAACYFASEEAGFTTGAVLDVNGGMFMG
jgi:3-oxoacyl-[acyl-carrier protein] reductase